MGYEGLVPPPSSPDELAEAERRLNAQPAMCCRGPAWLAARVSEFDRLRLVEQAATALVEHWDRLHHHDVETVRQVTLGTLVTLVDALAAAVRGEEERG